MTESDRPENIQEKGGAKTNVGQAVSGRWLIAGLCLLTLTAYSRVGGFDFIYLDDPLYFSRNPQVAAGLTWENIRWAFSTFLTGNWHPLTWISLMLDASLFGTSPTGPHLVNLAFHTGNTVLLYVLIRRMTKDVAAAIAVAGLFALHPLHVESVAWISERKDLLSTAFGFYALIAWHRHITEKRASFYWIAVLATALSLLSKPMLVSMPLLLLLMDIWPCGRLFPLKMNGKALIDPDLNPSGVSEKGISIREFGMRLFRLTLEKWPFILLALVSCVITLKAQSAGGAVSSLAKLPLIERLANAAVSYMAYLGKTVWPVSLSIFYPHPLHTPWGKAGIAVAAMMGISIFSVRQYQRRPWMPVGWLWYLITLIPVIGIVQVGGQSMADRYTYVPLVGIFLIAVMWLREIITDRRRFYLLVTPVLIVLSFLTVRQTEYWRNTETLFLRSISLNADDYLARNNLGAYYGDQGKLDKALPLFEEALRIYPGYIDAQKNLQRILALKLTDALEKADYPAAEGLVARLFRLKPGGAEAAHALSVQLVRRDQMDAARQYLEAAVQRNPELAEAHFDMGVLLARSGDYRGAIDAFNRVLSIRPGDEDARRQKELVEQYLQKAELVQ